MKSIKTELFRKNFLLEVACSLLVSFTLFFFGPLEIFLSESIEFWFSVSDILGLVIICTICCFCITLTIQLVASFFGNVILRVCSSLLAAIGLGLYIQGNWTFVDYGEMNGIAIDWGNYTGWAIADTAIWILVAVIIVLFIIKSSKYMASAYIMLGIVGIEVLTIGVLAVTMIGTQPKADFSLRAENEFHLSSNKNNIIVICADGFDGSDFLPVLEEEPDFKQYFDGFTFYEDTCGTSLYSHESGINLLTGKQFEAGLSFEENVNKAYAESNLYDVLEENNFETYLYLTEEKMVSSSIAGQVANFELKRAEINNFSDAFKQIYKMVSFRYVPHIFKKFFWYTSMDFASLKGDRENKKCLYFNYDVYDYIQEQGVSACETNHNIYQFYWIQGPHEPANTDRYCHKVGQITEMQDKDYSGRQFEQTIGVVRMYTQLICALKEAHVYDNTTIIFTADHGWDMRPNPCLLIKPAKSHGKFCISQVPVSMIEDYLPTLEYFITGKKDNGNTIYELKEGDSRKRSLYVYDLDHSNGTYTRIEEKYNAKAFSSKVRLGEKLLPDRIGFFAESGISRNEGTHIWTDGAESVFKFKLDKEYKNIQLSLNYDTFNGNQPVSIYANDTLIAQYNANGREEKKFMISGDYIKNKELILKFVFTKAVAPVDIDVGNKDNRKLALAFYSIKLSNISE